ncbi:MAG TPA: TIGR03086 family metal-binding protein, partial [Dehalococcoidia bacterium]|nr:TIGR03086 family metal-binding protein [Dehalococcoidia bacterium]
MVESAGTSQAGPLRDIEPATAMLSALVRDVRDDQLASPTPCQITVGELLDHVQSFAVAFTAAAMKSDEATVAGPAPKADVARLGDDWRSRIPQRLNRLAAAWREPQAWTGMTRVGGLDMPGEAAGVVALDEVILHGWDLAVATGQPFDPPRRMLEPLLPFLN